MSLNSRKDRPSRYLRNEERRAETGEFPFDHDLRDRWLLFLVPGFFVYATTRGEVTIALILGGALVLIGSWMMSGRSSLPPASHWGHPTSLPPTEDSLRQERRGKTS